MTLREAEFRCSRPGPAASVGLLPMPLTAASSRTPAAAAAFPRLITVPAEDRTIATRLKRHCCRLAATRTNHRCSLCRSRTVAGSPLIVLLCLTAILATLWGRITTFLKERLISRCEGEVLPAIAARKLNISGHVSPRGDCTAQSAIARKDSFLSNDSAPAEAVFLPLLDRGQRADAIVSGRAAGTPVGQYRPVSG
jgi:hypothetical protein